MYLKSFFYQGFSSVEELRKPASVNRPTGILVVVVVRKICITTNDRIRRLSTFIGSLFAKGETKLPEGLYNSELWIKEQLLPLIKLFTRNVKRK